MNQQIYNIYLSEHWFTCVGIFDLQIYIYKFLGTIVKLVEWCDNAKSPTNWRSDMFSITKMNRRMLDKFKHISAFQEISTILAHYFRKSRKHCNGIMALFVRHRFKNICRWLDIQQKKCVQFSNILGEENQLFQKYLGARPRVIIIQR